MSRDAKISSASFAFLLAALVVVTAASPIPKTGQDSAAQQTTSSTKPSSVHRAQAQQKTFSSAQQAAQALYEAARNHDAAAMLAVLGPGARDIVMWSDDSAERAAQDDVFVKK